jgi:aminomethyltransferase
VLAKLGLPAEHPYMSFVVAPFAGTEIVVCRTGYTGEHGYELVVPVDAAGAVWDAVFAGGGPFGVRAAGLGARDTLRTEAGLALHGQDLSRDISPVQARLGFAVGWSKPAFWGRERMLAERAAGPARTLRGLVAADRGIPRPHMTVRRAGADDAVGEVTSGTFSPTRRVGIALALLDTAAGLADGDTVEVDVRGRRSAMTVVKPPFVANSTR